MRIFRAGVILSAVFRRLFRAYGLGAVLFWLVVLALFAQAEQAGEKCWYKGHTHCHSFWSDGREFPEMVADRYKQGGYDFLTITDHNVVQRGERWLSLQSKDGKVRVSEADIDRCRQRFGPNAVEIQEQDGVKQVRLKTLDEIRSLLEEPGKFLLLEGEEITGPRVHMCAINLSQTLQPIREKNVTKYIQKNVQSVQEHAAKSGRTVIAQVNHPNWSGYRVSAVDLAEATEARFFEVCNCIPSGNHQGDAKHPGEEKLWDLANTLRIARGNPELLFGIASDDAHSYGARFGQGWIVVRAEKLEAEALMNAMQEGDFYASTGVVLDEYCYDKAAKQIHIRVREAPDVQYRIEFIGTLSDAVSPGNLAKVAERTMNVMELPEYTRVGEVLKTVEGACADYQFTGKELYVRAVIHSTKKLANPSKETGRTCEEAWCQPVVGMAKAVVAAKQNELPAALMKAWRKAAADHPRRLLMNNDGNEAVHQMTRPSVEDFLKCRTSNLAGTHVDSIFYCTTGGFSTFKHLTQVGQLFTLRMEPHPNNQLAAMAELGLDPLTIMTDFGKRQQMEIFWSFRMNDVHDKSRQIPYEAARFRFNKLKNEHPEYLLGTPKTRLKHGGWSGVDYGRPEIRNLAFRYVEEICRGYDVAGVELDFFRHPVFFRSTTRGEKATDAECAQMTELLQQIRLMADKVGKERGRPILIAVHVPDSVEYCRAIGLDIERWMADDLIDLLMVAGYFQINDWDYSVALARKFGVKVYPSLDESRVKDEAAQKMRATILAYRGRAANVWAARADGVYLFNCTDPAFPGYRELGDAKLLARLDKDYFASIRGVGVANGGNLPTEPYQKYETLNPREPKTIAPGNKATARIQLGEIFTETKPATLKFRLRFADAPNVTALRASVNGHPLRLQPAGKEWIEGMVEPAQLHLGANEVKVDLAENADEASWTDLVLEVRH